MQTSNNFRRIVRSLRHLTMVLLLLGSLACVAMATEGGASVYPIGAETVMPGMTPAPGASLLCEFSDFYQANGLVNSEGKNLMPGFHLRVAAVALKFTHNWGVHVLGGTLVSYAAMPLVNVHLTAPFGKGDKEGIGNPVFEPLGVAYERGALHWWYGYDFFTPGFSYNKNALVNVGQHNYAMAPAGAFTYLPKHKTEISSKFQYIMNGENDQLHYRSGNEFVWEYAGMQNITKNIAVGFNGYYYQQVTNDTQFGAIVGDGNRGRDFAIGPEIRAHVGHFVLISKYTRDTMVQNRPVGNSFWFQFGLPMGHGHE